MSLPTYITVHKEGFLIQIYVQPRASRTLLIGEHNNALKVAITAPPVDGEANAAVIELLSDSFGIPKRNIKLKSGHTGRSKSFILMEISESELLHKLESAL